MSDSPGKRLILFRKSVDLNQRDFAIALGTSRATVAFIEGDQRQPSRSFLQKISERYSVSADWLLLGAGDKFNAPVHSFQGRTVKIDPPNYSRPSHGDFSVDGVEFSMISRMDLSVSAGTGLIPVDGGERERMAFPNSLLNVHNINSDLAVLVKVQGDSMMPGITDGSLALVHVPEKSVSTGGIFAFNREGASYIKRLIPGGQHADGRPSSIVILSDNPSYPPETVSGEAMNDIQIVGRVRYVLNSY